MKAIKRDHLLTLRVSTAEMRRIKLLAKRMDMTVSEMIRTLVNQRSLNP